MSRVDIGEQNTTGVRESHTASICKLLEEYGGRERLLTAEAAFYTEQQSEYTYRIKKSNV